MNKNTILDPSISSSNIGDDIISLYARKILDEVFPNDFFYNIPTHEIIGSESFKKLNDSKQIILGGSNILNSKMFPFAILNNWKIGITHALRLKGVITLGCGWANYQNKDSWFSKIIYNRIFKKTAIHSVRDGYTLKKFNNIGIPHVVNTGCHTMWSLTEEHCKEIPIKKSENVIFTLTYYRNNTQTDTFLIETLLKNYKKVYFWPQQIKDLQYFKDLGDFPNVIIVPPKLHSYTNILQQDNLDYVGSRLHGGIHALNNKKRSIIIGVDNRAIEISKDTNLKVIPHTEMYDSLEKNILSDFETKIHLPTEAINMWKNQFKK